MSLFSDLERLEKHPGSSWGRSSYGASDDKFPDTYSDGNPENDEVCLVSPKSNGVDLRSKTSDARNCRQNTSYPKFIEIKDNDKVTLRSSADKNPKDFHASCSGFVIPKTKQETGAKSPASNDTITEETRKKKRSELTFESNCQGRSISKKKDDINSEPFRIRRDWNHAERPRVSPRTSASSDALTKISRDYGDNAEGTKVDEPIRNGDHPTAYTRHLRSRVSNNSSTRPSILDDCGESSDVDDFRDDKKALTSSKTRQPQIPQACVFCEFCGGALSKGVCKKCGDRKVNQRPGRDKSLSVGGFYSKYGQTYSAKTPSGIKPAGRTKMLTAAVSVELTAPAKKQTEIGKSGDLELPAQGRRKAIKRKCQTKKEPELVHISSDEEDMQDCEIKKSLTENEVGGQDPMTSNVDITNTSLSDEDNTFQEEMDETVPEKEEHEKVQEVTPKEPEDLLMDTDSETPATEVKPTTEVEPKKTEKTEKTVNDVDSFQRDALKTLLMVRRVNVGRLHGSPTAPVEVNANRITIEMAKADTNYNFKLQGRDIASFKINNDFAPCFIMIVPTPGWARKVNERYREDGLLIDPGSSLCEERQIILFLAEAIVRSTVADLMELVCERLCCKKVFEQMTAKNAEKELKRLHPSSGNRRNSESSTKQPSLSESDESTKPEAKRIRPRSLNGSTSEPSPITKSFLSLTSCVSPSDYSFRKSYNTRSKDVSQASFSEPPQKLFVYPPSCKYGGVTITTEDVRCLEPNTYLNDVIIDFFMKYLFEEVLNGQVRDATHIFSSYFYNRLTQKNRNAVREARTPEYMHSLVKTWTKNVDIFSKDFLIFPINESSHWYLLIICYPGLVAEQTDENYEQDESEEILSSPYKPQETDESGNNETNENQEDAKRSETDDDAFDMPLSKTKTKRKTKKKKAVLKSRPCILVFDSLGGCHRSTVLVNLRNYLSCEWKERKGNTDKKPVTFDKNTLKGCYPKVPGQDNMSDCGLYILQYVESFFQTPIVDYNFPIELPGWFPVQVVREKRESIKKLIHKLQHRVDVDTSS